MKTPYSAVMGTGLYLKLSHYLSGQWGPLSGNVVTTLTIFTPDRYLRTSSRIWIDFRGIRDAFMRAKGIDY